MGITLSLLAIATACVGIMLASNVFEPASDYLGRNMPDGVKGATINAIGSSMPELLTTFILLFWHRSVDGFSGGIATTAGSAVFNAVLIPGAVLFAVLIWKATTTSVQLDRRTLVRDGTFVLIAEILLIWFLSSTTMYWWMGAALMSVYACYFGYLMYQMYTHGTEDNDTEEEEEEPAEPWVNNPGNFLAMAKGKKFQFDSNIQAWSVLVVAVGYLGIFCHMLADATVALAQAWNLPVFITTVVFAAAATSVPDTVISIKDALKGNYDDAVANAVGSNIFDVCVSLGLPLFIYGLVYGPVELGGVGNADVQILRWVMLGFTAAVLYLFYRGSVGKKTAYGLLSMYSGWLLFILYRALQY